MASSPKYYPPEFDPSKIPRGKRNKNATFNIRIMAPFNMRCNMCKDYIYKGKKFNSRKEDVTDEDYLGLRIFRFYIKCPRCVSEIAFKTDLVNTDYTLEAGATRLFEAEKIAHQMAEKERKEREEDELNPMKVLENRTKASQQEMEQIDSLEELREINSRKNTVNTDEMIEKYRKYEELLQQLQIEQEEKEIQEIFGSEGTKVVKRLADSDSDDDEPVVKKPALDTGDKPTDILAQDNKPAPSNKKTASWERSVGGLSTQGRLKGLVVKKKTTGLTSSPICVGSAKGNNSKQTVTVGSESDPSKQGSDSTENSQAKSDSHTSNVAATTSAAANRIDATGELGTAKPDGNSDSCKINGVDNSVDSSSDSATASATKPQVGNQTVAQPTVTVHGGGGGLGLLGAYSDTDSDSSG